MDSLMVADSSVLQLMGYLQGKLPWILILVASAAVMQLVTTIVLLTGRKGGRGYRQGHDRRPGAQSNAEGRPDKGQSGQRRPDGGGGGQKKQGDNNRGGSQRQGGQQGGRPQHDRGGRPNQTSIDPVEMSLRDINQRLKNADREQENARKSMRDGGDSDGEGRGRDGRQQQQRGGGRDNRDGGQGGGRGGNRDRDDRGQRRDSGRDNRGGNRQERQDRGGDGAKPQQEQHDRFRPNDHAAEAPERHQAPEIIPNDMGVPEDQLQHGRRFTAKRRTLPDAADAPEEQRQNAPESASAPTAGSEPFDGQGQGGAEDIQFGR